MAEAKKMTAKVKKQEADDGVNTRVVDRLTASIVFLTEAKAKLYPISEIQARGFISTGPIEIGKRLIWLSPGDERAQAAEISEGENITAQWLLAVCKRRLDSVAIHIAGDAGAIAGTLADPENPTNWVISLEFDYQDGSIRRLCQRRAAPRRTPASGIPCPL